MGFCCAALAARCCFQVILNGVGLEAGKVAALQQSSLQDGTLMYCVSARVAAFLAATRSRNIHCRRASGSQSRFNFFSVLKKEAPYGHNHDKRRR